MVDKVRKMLLLLFVSLFITLFVTFFGHGTSIADRSIVYRLKWLINMSTVGDVFALTQGIFKAQGLDVDIKPGGPERDAIREIELGHADFGVASADQVLKAASKGAPVVVIAQLFQVNPLQWIYFKDRVAVRSPKDLARTRIGVTFGKNDEYIMRTLLAKSGINDRKIDFFSVRLDYTPFYKRQVDLWPVYINTQGIEIGRKLKAAGEQIGFLNPEQFGIKFVANSVITSRRMVTKHPDLANSFLTALLSGWRAALEGKNVQTAIDAVRQFDRDTDSEILKAQLETTRALVQPESGTKVGTIDVKAWKQTEKIMLDYGLINRPVDVEAYLMVR